jgi:SAM-dependent methyltransferase
MRSLRQTCTPGYVAVNRKTYDALAEEYKNRMQCMSSYEDSPEILGKSILAHISSNCTRGKMLEIGPGAGQILKYFAENGFYTVGVELSEKMAGIARITSPQSKIINKNILDFSVDEKFQIIYMGAIIHLFPKSVAAILIRKMYKLLASNGLLFVNTTVSKKSSEGYLTKTDYKNQCKRFRKQWTEMELKKVLIQNNYRIIQKLQNNEADRNKEWVAFICSKTNLEQE